MLEHRLAYENIPQPDKLSQLPVERITGIYFLWRGDELVYVGQSRNLTERVLGHIQMGSKVFDGVSYIEHPLKGLTRFERFLIERLLPKYNKCSFSNRCRKERSWGLPPRLTRKRRIRRRRPRDQVV